MDSTPPTLVIATVGTGRNRKDIAEAILFSLRRNGADRAVFLCSGKTREETFPLVEKGLAADGWSADRYRVYVCEDEDDVQRLFVEWNACWDDWLDGRFGDEVVVEFTSGTKPMSAAAVLLGVAREASCLSYVTGDRDDTGRVTVATGVRSIAPDRVLAHRRLQMAVEHFHTGSYAVARDIARPLCESERLPDEHLRAIALSVHLLGEAYEAWDRFDYRAAAAKLRDSQRYWPQDRPADALAGRPSTMWTWVENAGKLAANYALIQAVRDAVKDGEFAPAIAGDLLANADRCLRRKDWDDAVTRLYRACELLAQIRLWREYKQKTGNIDPTQLPDLLRAEYAKRKEACGKNKLELGLREAYRLLEQLEDPLGTEFAKRYGTHDRRGELQGLLGSRNSSLLAHGVVPIRKEHAEQLRRHVGELADVADPAICRDWLSKAEPIRFKPF
ncbi:MAG: TIGR02710 family CRISPR-associated CARF protein [Phycisphaerae bacterium]